MVSKVDEEISVLPEDQQSNRDFWPLVNKDPAFFLPPMISRAQNFEDVILRRALQDITRGFYVDIGAWHPVDDSITSCFYESGWSGINVEPNPHYFAELELARTRDTNIACVVGAKSGTCLFTVIEGTGLSSGLPASIDASRHPGTGEQRVITMPCVTLDELLALSGANVVDFLKIDVEGMEADVICGSSFALHRPRIIVVEAVRPLTQIPNHADWEKHLLSKGYEFVLFDGLNRFYLRQDEAWRKPLFSIPPCVFDNFRNPTFAARAEELELATRGRLQEATDLAEALDTRLVQAEDSYRRVMHEAAQAKEQAAVVEAQRDRFAVERSEALDERDAAIAKHAQTGSELAAMTAERNRLADERDTLDVYSKLLQSSHDTIAAERQTAVKALAAVTAERQTAVKELAAVTAERQKAVNELAAVTAERQKALKDLADTTAERDRLAGERAVLVTELYRLVREQISERRRIRWRFF